MKLLNLFTGRREKAEAPEIAENGADKVLFQSEQNSNVRKRYMNFASAQKRAVDAPLYAISSGRSMVEMLGVLAIVGVLSVGAITGYQKAMFKYKLNKHAESFSSFLNSAIQLTPQLDRAFTGEDISSSTFIKLNIVPDGMTIKEDTIYDVFKNRISIYYYHHSAAPAGQNEYYIFMYVERANNKSTDRFREICRNVIIAARENADNVSNLQLRSTQSPTGAYTKTILWGNYNCTSNSTCLYNASLAEMDEFCDSCDSEYNCQFYVFIRTKV